MPAILESFPLTITAIPKQRTPTPDPDIEITSEEEPFALTPEQPLYDKETMATKPTELKAGLPGDFSERNEDATWWLLTMKAYFLMNKAIYDDLPELDKTFKKLCEAFEDSFIPKYLKDQAHQTIYSLSMDQFWGDFDQYATAFRLAQACSGIDADNILVNALCQACTKEHVSKPRC